MENFEFGFEEDLTPPPTRIEISHGIFGSGGLSTPPHLELELLMKKFDLGFQDLKTVSPLLNQNWKLPVLLVSSHCCVTCCVKTKFDQWSVFL